MNTGLGQVLVWLIGVSTSGCSVFMTTAPAEPSRRTREAAEACTSSVLTPVFDSVSAGIGGVNMAISASVAPDKVRWYGIEMDHETGFALGVTQLAVFGASAVYGYVQAARCSRLQAEFGSGGESEGSQQRFQKGPGTVEAPSDEGDAAGSIDAASSEDAPREAEGMKDMRPPRRPRSP